MRKLLIALVLVALTVPCLVSFTSPPSHVWNGDGLITADEESELEALLADAGERSGIAHYAILYTADYSTISEREMASRLGIDLGSDNAVILAVWQSGVSYYYELFTYGEAYGLISDSDAVDILDSKDVHLIKSGRLADGLRGYTNVSSAILVRNRTVRWVIVIAVAAVLAALAGAGAIFGVYYLYKRKLKSPIYPLSKYARMQLTHANDVFLGSNVTRVRVSSSGSSGRGGGGGSRGGSRGSR